MEGAHIVIAWYNDNAIAIILNKSLCKLYQKSRCLVILFTQRFFWFGHMPGAIVGTVDKFQGQEAPIAIYSMATSSHADAPRGMEFLYSLNRLNVATSRAKCLSIIVSSPQVFEAECRTPRQIQLANALCRYLELAEEIDIGAASSQRRMPRQPVNPDQFQSHKHSFLMADTVQFLVDRAGREVLRQVGDNSVTRLAHYDTRRGDGHFRRHRLGRFRHHDPALQVLGRGTRHRTP